MSRAKSPSKVANWAAVSPAKDSAKTSLTIWSPAWRSSRPVVVKRWRTARPAGDAFDQAPVDHPSGQATEGLVRLKCQLGQVVKGGVWVVVQVAQGVPLHEAGAQGRQFGIDGPMVTHLQPLDGQANVRKGPRHGRQCSPPQSGCLSQHFDIRWLIKADVPEKTDVPQVETPDLLRDEVLPFTRAGGAGQ